MLCIFQDRFSRLFRAIFALVSRLVFGQLPLALMAARVFFLGTGWKVSATSKDIFSFLMVSFTV